MLPDDKIMTVSGHLNQSALSAVQSQPRDTVPPIPADPGSTGLAFESAVVRYVSDWLLVNAVGASKAFPFAFVLSRSIESDAIALEKIIGTGQFERYQAFHSQKMIDVSGSIIFVTMNLEAALVVKVVGVENSQKLFDAITKWGFVDRYIAAFEPPKSNLIIADKGFKHPSRSQCVSATIDRSPWKLNEFEQEIAEFHDDYTRTPDARLVPWSSAAKGITGEKLEVRISKTLADILDRKWKRGSILAESSTSMGGRIDIFVQAHVLEDGAGPCVVEVKVLRESSKRRPLPVGHASWWAKKGIIQADLYRTDRRAASAYLYSFDARGVDADLLDVDKLAVEKSVHHRRHFMYRSTDALIEAKLKKAGG